MLIFDLLSTLQGDGYKEGSSPGADTTYACPGKNLGERGRVTGSGHSVFSVYC